MKKRIFRLLLLTLCAAGLLSSLGTAAMAADRIDYSRDVSLTVNAIVNNQCIPEMTVSVYRVADMYGWGNFSPCGSFRDYGGAINGWTTAEEWEAAAKGLADFVSKNNLTALCRGKTNEVGVVTFSDKLEPGLFLITFGQAQYNGKIYTARPLLVTLPHYDEYSDSWKYDVSINAKGGVVPTPGPTPPPYLPKTGQLWWPVPVLLCGGLFLLLVGVVKRRSRTDEEA